VAAVAAMAGAGAAGAGAAGEAQGAAPSCSGVVGSWVLKLGIGTASCCRGLS
jgi:hypothetical protein